jgi:hypothetical protein
MIHQPKFTTACQSLINACQATEHIIGARLILPLETANRFSRVMRPDEVQLFDIRHNADSKDKTFTVTLRDQQPQPTTPTE